VEDQGRKDEEEEMQGEVRGKRREVRITKLELPTLKYHRARGDMIEVFKILQRAVQWHYIDKLSNDTVPNRTFITTNHQALFIYNLTKIMG